jgi:hypothetical protein
MASREAGAGPGADAGGFGVELVSARRAKGTAAEAKREDFTKPRRDTCRAMAATLSITASDVKERFGTLLGVGVEDVP